MKRYCAGEPGDYDTAEFKKAPNGQWVHNVTPLHYPNGSLVEPDPIPGPLGILSLPARDPIVLQAAGELLPPGFSEVLEQDEQAGVPNSRRWLLVFRLAQTALTLSIPALEQLVANGEELARE